jgi:7-cyano-7-deazaguanine tRNA-ribosyltransferase
MDTSTRIIELAKHNLFVLRMEINILKQAITDGRLWEYVVQKARSHPKLMEALAYVKNHPIMESGTKKFKIKAAFFFDSIDYYRPEARLYREMIARFKSSKSRVLFYPLVREYQGFQICSYNAFLGIIPVELCDIYPAAHNLSNQAVHFDEAMEYSYDETIKSLKAFVNSNHFEEIVIYANHAVKHSLDRIQLDHSNVTIFEYDNDRS